MAPAEVADIFRIHGPSYRETHKLPLNQLRTMHAIETCRTAELGGHVDACEECGHTKISYNSCRNRHCPKCQFLKKEKWVEARGKELLPIEYFHVVFTLPDETQVACPKKQRGGLQHPLQGGVRDACRLCPERVSASRSVLRIFSIRGGRTS